MLTTVDGAWHFLLTASTHRTSNPEVEKICEMAADEGIGCHIGSNLG